MNLNKNRILVLNSCWKAVNELGGEKLYDVIGAMYGGSMLALDQNDPGDMFPTKWADWIDLPVRPGDDTIATSKGKFIRLPRVVIARNYERMHIPTTKLTATNVHIRDEHTCVYCGKKLPRVKLNLDHVYPSSRGGESTWENLGSSCIKCNTFKADRTPEEAGMRLRKKLKAPSPLPLMARIVPVYPEWTPFVITPN